MQNKFKKIKIKLGLLSYILIGVCVALILTDLLTKIFEERDGWNFTVIPGFIEVVSGSRNPGCAFSFLANAAWGQTFLIVTTFILLAVLVGIFLILPERFTLLKIALTLIIAGAIGNLIDRIAFREVRDFVGIRMFGRMVYCNFADFWITFGSVIAVIDMLFINEWSLFPLTKSAREAQKRREQQKKSEEAAETPSADSGENVPTEIPSADSVSNENEANEACTDGVNDANVAAPCQKSESETSVIHGESGEENSKNDES